MCWTTWEAMKALDGKRAAERALFHAVPHEHWRLDFSSRKLRRISHQAMSGGAPCSAFMARSAFGISRASADFCPLLRCSDPHECLNSCNGMFTVWTLHQFFDDILLDDCFEKLSFMLAVGPAAGFFLFGPAVAASPPVSLLLFRWPYS